MSFFSSTPKLTRRVALGLAVAAAAPAQRTGSVRPTVALEGDAARVVIDLLGGSIVRFELKPDGLNPLVWNNAGPADEPRSMSHFLCLDRWGQPSQAELANGMPFHGEATKLEWRVDDPPRREGTRVTARMSVELPMAGLRVERRVELDSPTARLRVVETVVNQRKLGRMYNMVQHPTVGPPFLDASTVVDTNARKGFMQSSPMPNPEEPPVWFPEARKPDGTPVDMRRLDDDPLPNVVSYTFDSPQGWTTAATPSKGLLIGYTFSTEEYPWLNLWRHVADGRPLARGLEFGTTGLHQPFPVLARKGRIFGRPLFDYLDAGESRTRSFTCFLLKVPADFTGVADVRTDEARISVVERGPDGRRLTVGG